MYFGSITEILYIWQPLLPASGFYAGIKKELKTLTDIQIVSLEEIIGQALFYGSGEM